MEQLTAAYQHLKVLREMMRDVYEDIDAAGKKVNPNAEDIAYYRALHADIVTLSGQVSAEIATMTKELVGKIE